MRPLPCSSRAPLDADHPRAADGAPPRLGDDRRDDRAEIANAFPWGSAPVSRALWLDVAIETLGGRHA